MLDLLEVLRNAVLITGLVLIMMLMIEYCNIGSHGSLFARLKSSGINQVLIGTLLGLVPGCIGGFAAVSLFTHKLLSFGALTAMMIASSGDEAFVMLATMPLKALLLFAILGALAIVTGLVCDRISLKSRILPFVPMAMRFTRSMTPPLPLHSGSLPTRMLSEGPPGSDCCCLQELRYL